MALVAKYSLNGNANNSLGVNNGTATNITWVDGKLNQAAKFNGSSSYITVATTPSLTSNRSIEFIINTTTTTQGAIYSKWANSSSQRQIHIYNTAAGKITMDIPWIVGGIVTSAKSINDGFHHHVVITRSGNVWTIYVDGVSDATATNTSGQEANSGQFTLGKDNTTSSQYFNGSIDELQLYNHVLTAGEIKMKYLYYLGYM